MLPSFLHLASQPLVSLAGETSHSQACWRALVAVLGRETSKLLCLSPCWKVPRRLVLVLVRMLLLVVPVVLVLLVLPLPVLLLLLLLLVLLTLMVCFSPVSAQPSRRLFCSRRGQLVLLTLLGWVLSLSLQPSRCLFCSHRRQLVLLTLLA